MIVFRIICGAVSLVLAACAAQSTEVAAISAAPGKPLRDHHSHLQSPLVIEAMARGCRAKPEICPPKLPPPRTSEDMLRDLDEAGIPQSVAVSTAYLIAIPIAAGDGLNVSELVRAENQFAAEQVARDPRRLLLAVGIPVLHESAEAELDYWLKRPEVAAVKVHLTANGFSFRNSDHVDRLKWAFARAGAARKGILIHMRTFEPDYGARDVETFLREVVPAAGGQPIQIAHAGGWGGYDAATGRILDAFSAAARSGSLPPNVWFDISGIAFPSVPPERLQAATEKLRALGVRRLVFGSDSGMEMTPALAWRLMREGFAFTEPEWEKIRANQVPL